MRTPIHDRVDTAREGRSSSVVRKVPSGWIVMGDSQFLEGYCMLLPDPVVSSLNDLSLEARAAYLRDLALLGDALLEVTPSHRMNYEILCNKDPALHAHVFPRYRSEPAELRELPVWSYDRSGYPAFDPTLHAPLMARIRGALENLYRRHGIPL